MEKEIWKDVKGYDGKYQISNYGKVKSFKRGNSYIIMKLCISYNGYYRCVLCKNSIKEKVRINRLVAEYFVPNPENKPFVNHKDCNKLNNYYENLEWCTQAENGKHASINDLFPQGESSRVSKLKEFQVEEILKLCALGKTCKSIAEKYNVHESNISCIRRRKTWRHIDRIKYKEQSNDESR